MAENKKIRLNRIAKEYNVGIGTIAEFLAKNGIAIDPSPSVILGEAAFDLVAKEFGNGRTLSSAQKPAPAKTVEEPSEPAAETPAKPQDEQKSVMEEETIQLARPKILGTIDLGGSKTPKAKVEKSEPAPKEETPEVPAKVEAPQEVETPKVETPKVEAPKVETAPKVEAPKVEASKVEEKVEAAPVVESKPEVSPVEVVAPATPEVAPEPVVAEKTEEIAPEKAAAAVASEKASEPATATPAETTSASAPSQEEAKVEAKKDDVPFRAQTKALTGPKILGKIELPVAASREDRSRKKRNRIKKNKVDVTAPQTTTGGTAATPAARPQGGGGGNFGGGGGQRQGGGPGAGKRPNQNANRNRPAPREAVSEEDVQRQMKETLSRLTSKGSKTKASKHRRDKRDERNERMAESMEQQAMENKTLKVTEFVTVSELATMMNVPVTNVITACMNLGLMVSINQRLDAEALVIVAEEFDYKVEFVSVEIQEAIENEVDNPDDLISRPPIVTVMGHVDHGKTSLLDYIRKANVIAGEAGGITQHIGAYSVELEDGRKVTFLDTPGHEAFTAMRARGAKVTDVAIIIIAADDSIMPQTKEAINHAEAAGVPIIFAINKIDKDGANPEKIKEQLGAMNYLVEEWGGKYQSQDIAAKTGLNIEQLLEKVVLEAEVLELKANPKRKASGSVIESSLDKGRGYVTTILVQNGTLKVGDVLLSGIYTGRVKAMFNERGNKVEEAGPATPVLVLGLNGAPQAGDTFNVMDDDKSAREIATKREQLQRMQGLRTQKHITLDEIGRRIAIGSFKELNIIVKGDVDGSIEALTDSLIKLSNEEVQVNVIHKAVGQISESDVLLAAASNAIIVGFQVRPSNAARRLAEKEEIDIRLYSIIYDAIGEIKDAIEGMLAPETKEEIVCSVEVLETFKISKVGTVAGCIVREGKIHRNTQIRIIRDGIVVYTGSLGSLKRFKDDVKEVNNGMDCGLNIENFNDIKVGDFIEGYQQIQIARKL